MPADSWTPSQALLDVRALQVAVVGKDIPLTILEEAAVQPYVAAMKEEEQPMAVEQQGGAGQQQGGPGALLSPAKRGPGDAS